MYEYEAEATPLPVVLFFIAFCVAMMVGAVWVGLHIQF